MPAPVTAPPAAGDTIDDRYVLEDLLGEGTFGGVWRARDRRLADRPVAVKFLKAEFLAQASAVARFEAEANALAHLSHPNIVGVLDRGRWRDQRFIVMELVEGRSLAAWIARHRDEGVAPELADAVTVFDQLCAGIEAAHAVRSPGPIVHRDLKPDNVLLRTLPSGDLGVKVLDFGIAQLGGRNGTRSGALMGTPLYMAPEQAMGQTSQIGPWTDVFSLAVLFVEMLTGRPQPDAEEPWWGAALQRPQAIRGLLGSLRADVPAALWDELARALRPTGAERHAHAGVLRAALRHAAGGASGAGATTSSPAGPLRSTPPDLGRISTVEVSPPPRTVAEEPGASWLKVLVAVAAAAVLLAGAFVALLVSLDGRPRARPTRASSPAPAPAPAAPEPASTSAAAVTDFLLRWERSHRREPGADGLPALYANALRYHGTEDPPDFAAMTRDFDRAVALGGTFTVDQARTEVADEPLEAAAVPRACRLVTDAEGPVVRVRAWVTEERSDRHPDVGCPRLTGRYLLRLRATPAGLRICHETWSRDEGICASCPTAPLCRRRTQ